MGLTQSTSEDMKLDEAFLSSLTLEKHDGTKVSAAEALKGKLIGVYFSAHWCPPCRKFTPVLKDFYGQVKDDLEIIFVSSDRSEAALKDYMKEAHGDWYHLSFNDSNKGKFSEACGVRGIPQFSVLKQDGTIITNEGRADVSSGNPKSTIAKWKAA